MSAKTTLTKPTQLSNQNLLHVKFRLNKFEDNLLSKRLKQLDIDEMKWRLRSQRDSNDMTRFLRDCKSTTGYLDSPALSAERRFEQFIKLNTMPPIQSSPIPKLIKSTQFDDQSSANSSGSSANIEFQSFCCSKSKTPPSPSSRSSSSACSSELIMELKKTRTLCCSNLTESSEALSPNNWLTSTFNFDEVKVEPVPKQKMIKSETKGAKTEFQSRSLNVLLNSNEFSRLIKDKSTMNTFLTSTDASKRKKLTNKAEASRVDLLKRPKQVFPIQVSMSRGLLRKKQSEIVNQQECRNSMQLVKNFQQTQILLNRKVQMFSHKLINS